MVRNLRSQRPAFYDDSARGVGEASIRVESALFRRTPAPPGASNPS
jgi:hypothetical protein